MSDLFLFRFDDESNDRKQSIVVFGANELNSIRIEEAIKIDVSINLTPSKIYVISLSSQRADLKALSQDQSKTIKFSSLISNDESSIEFISVSNDGAFESLKTESPLDLILQNKIMAAGGIEIFRKRRGILKSSPHYHFVKPSGDHCDKFIRVSNLLTSGNEVSFLALGVLPHIHGNMKHIYVDTSSISFLIMTALQLSGKYQSSLPVIESFESYSAFNKKYDFVEAATSSVFISATTSGGLNAKLNAETNLYRDKIVTLFFSNLLEGQKGVFNISSAMKDDIYSKPAALCKLCKDNSKLINIVGEQFLPEIPRHEKLLICKPHFKKNRENFFSEFATHGLLHSDKIETPNIREHFYIDIASFLKDEELSKPFIKKLNVILNKSFSRDIKTIVTLDDSGSNALKEQVIKYLNNEEENYQWLTLTELETKEFDTEHSALVIAGSITSGRKLLSASRRLRALNIDTAIKYLVGISKLPTEVESIQLSKDLEQGGNELIILNKCPLPRIKEHVVTAWELEKGFLSQFIDDFEDNITSLPQTLSVRNTEVRDSKNGLFLNDPNDKPLVLRDGFAFWSSLNIDCSKASQADVYWTMQTIMHDLRVENSDTGLESTYHSTVLSPICFDRYNDGIIQACILRAATPGELNYTIDKSFSRQMADVLISIIKNWNIAQGEGCLEFLMALATKRMKVLDSDLTRVLALSHEVDMNDTVKFLLNCIANSSEVNIPTKPF